jgi:hypothetical protein
MFRKADPPFYNGRGDHYLIREFAKACAKANHPIDEASLGRYLRDDNPVIPTPDRVRDLSAVFSDLFKEDILFLELMIEIGYITRDDVIAYVKKHNLGSKKK